MITTFTVYTRQLFNKFAGVITSSQKRRLVINYTIGVVLFVVAAYCLATRKYILATFFAIFGALFSCSRLISVAFINRINARQLNTYDRYSFYDGKFSVSSFLAGGTPYAQTEHQYNDISSIEFFTTFAYVFLSTGETYIFLRENFKQPEQFDWLMQNLMATANAKKLGVSYSMPSVSEYVKNFGKVAANEQTDPLDKMLAEREKVATHNTPSAEVLPANKGAAKVKKSDAKDSKLDLKPKTKNGEQNTKAAKTKSKVTNVGKKTKLDGKPSAKEANAKAKTIERPKSDVKKKTTTKAKSGTKKAVSSGKSAKKSN